MSSMVIAKCCVMTATCFDSNKDLKPDLENAFNAANKKIPPSNSIDHICTGVALGVLSAGAGSAFGSLAGGLSAANCLGTFKEGLYLLTPTCAFICPADQRIIMDPEDRALYPNPVPNNCTSGAFRDFRVVKETLRNYQEIVEMKR